MTFGCLNMDCCQQVENIISFKFSTLSACCLVLAFYLVLFISNQNYMVKVISRYQIRFLNHRGDLFNFAMILLFTGAYFGAKMYTYEQIGPPIVDFAKIVPKGSSLYTYYGLPNPKTKKEMPTIDL